MERQMKILNWALPLATLAACLGLLGFCAVMLGAQSSGLPFDLRPLGYSLTEAQAYLSHLTPSGTALYLGPIRLMDTLFPILFTLTLCLPMRGRDQLWFLPALAYGILDLSENIAVARILRAGTEVQAHAVTLASGMTEAKYAALAVAVLLALYALWQARLRR
jgi:hypothetical protein